jgi:4-coumarate--CoA ligase
MTIYTSRFAPVELSETSITDFVLRHAERLADKPALIDGPSGRVVTYGALRTQILSLAGGLRARGVGEGTTVALMSPNVPEFAVVFHAVAALGATVTTLNPTYRAEELAYQLRDSGAEWMFTVGLFAEEAAKACDAVEITQRVLIGPAADGWEGLAGLMGAPIEGPVAVDAGEDVVVLPYSSGTTGFPKGVMLTHKNLVANLEQCEPLIQLGEDEVIFAVLPFFHIYGMTVLMNFGLARGATIVTAPRFDMVQMLELTQEHEITRLFLVPPIVLALAKHPIVDEYDLSSVRQVFSGAAPLSGELGEAVSARLGCTVAQGYGMTEMSPVSHAIADGEERAGSSGTLVPNTEARLIDPTTGADAEPGEEGELWVRGPQVMKGYLANPEATAATLDADGWLHTGDIARIDDDGHTYIVDRLKELIKVKGFQVPPAELEALLTTHDAIADAAVIGVPDEEAGERPKAFVVAAAGAELDEEAVKAFVAERVATYKQLAQVVFVEAIPKSASGKILRRELRDS